MGGPGGAPAGGGEELHHGSSRRLAETSWPAGFIQVHVGLVLEDRPGLAVDGDGGVRVDCEVPGGPVDFERHLGNALGGLLVRGIGEVLVEVIGERKLLAGASGLGGVAGVGLLSSFGGHAGLCGLCGLCGLSRLSDLRNLRGLAGPIGFSGLSAVSGGLGRIGLGGRSRSPAVRVGLDGDRDVRIVHPAVEEGVEDGAGGGVEQAGQPPVAVGLLDERDGVRHRVRLVLGQLPVRVDVLDDALRELGDVLDADRRGEIHEGLLDLIRVLRVDGRRQVVDGLAEGAGLVRREVALLEVLRDGRALGSQGLTGRGRAVGEVVTEVGATARLMVGNAELALEEVVDRAVPVGSAVADAVVVREHVGGEELDPAARLLESLQPGEGFAGAQRPVPGRSGDRGVDVLEQQRIVRRTCLEGLVVLIRVRAAEPGVDRLHVRRGLRILLRAGRLVRAVVRGGSRCGVGVGVCGHRGHLLHVPVHCVGRSAHAIRRHRRITVFDVVLEQSIRTGERKPEVNANLFDLVRIGASRVRLPC